jgi:hypothetical protein
MPESVQVTPPVARKRTALLVDYDNFVTQCSSRGLPFTPAKLMERVRQSGEVVAAYVFVDPTTIEPQIRQEMFLAGLTVIDCPKMPTRHSEYLKDMVDPALISQGYWLVRYGLVDTIIVASADRDYVTFINDLRNVGIEVLIMVPSRFESPELLRAADGQLTYHLEVAEGDGPRAKVMRMIMNGDFQSEDQPLRDYLLGLAAILVVMANEFDLNVQKRGFRFLQESLLCHRELVPLELHETDFRERLELLLEAGVLRRESLPPLADPSKRTERCCYRLNLEHPFTQHALELLTPKSD